MTPLYRHDKPLVATHLPLLTRVFDISEGDVLEIGTGYYSTLLLQWLSHMYKRDVYSYESSDYWYKRSQRMQKSPYQHTIKCDNWDKADFDQKYWGMVFIDHSPNERRVVEIARLANKTDYMVIHDTDPETGRLHHYGYDKIWNLFKYRYDYTKIVPWTTVVSNVKDLSNFTL